LKVLKAQLRKINQSINQPINRAHLECCASAAFQVAGTTVTASRGIEVMRVKQQGLDLTKV
jgi:hypothetical protein